MKTIFKKGMKVYDQFNSPDTEGVVVEVIDNECDDYPIVVSFLNEYDIYYYTPEGRFNKGDIPTLSTKPYKIEFQGFEQKAPTPTYEEAEEWIRKEYAKGNNHLMMKDVLEALRKLIILRDYYNEGWQPDWNDDTTKYVIKCVSGDLSDSISICVSYTMNFKSQEIAKKFIKEQKELLEIAKPLL